MTARLLVGCLVTLTGCSEAKPAVELPTIEPGYRVEPVGSLADSLIDVGYLATSGELLLVADESGLHIYDITDPGRPSFVAALTDVPVHRVRPVGDVAYIIDVDGDNRLRTVDLSDPRAPAVIAEVYSPTARFGGLDAQPGLIWHAVGQIPPSRLYYGDSVDDGRVCHAPDRERGTMDAWLFDDLAVVSIHFDDFAGDSLDGGGAFGFALYRLGGPASDCPELTLGDIVFISGHDKNRSAFEQPQNSDLQAAFDAAERTLYITGEQTLASFAVDTSARVDALGTLAIPELIDVELDTSCAECGPLALVTNGDFGLVDASSPDALRLVGYVETAGISRSAAPAGDGRHVYIADGERGVAIVRYEKDSP